MQYDYVNYMQYNVKQCNNAMRVAGLAVLSFGTIVNRECQPHELSTCLDGASNTC